jgi:cytochrome c oxidase subunit 3
MAQVATQSTPAPTGLWSGGHSPFGASYGKLMMWFFLLSDAFTFSALLIAYGTIRVYHDFWPKPEEVFSGVPFFEGHAPLVFVGIMTFILIMSSVTMVLAVEAGHRNDRKEVVKWMLATMVGGAMFLGCQAWEWTHMIHEGASLVNNPFASLNHAGQTAASLGAVNPTSFTALFFVITGFHGFHVFSGVVILGIVAYLAFAGHFDKVGHYEMIEKVGLYWHFVDLVWVFVFTCFYLV